MVLVSGVVNGTCQEEGERLMLEKPVTARNWKRVCGGMVASGLLLAGTAGAYDVDGMADSAAWQNGYGGMDSYPSSDPDYGGLRLLDPGYAFSAYDVYGYPGSGVRDYGGAGGYGYPDHGVSGFGYPGYGSGYGSGYGPITRSYSSPPYSGAPNSSAVADRAYIRQLEERIRKLENANKQSLPAYGERSNSPAMTSFSTGQPAYQAPAVGQFGQPNYPGAVSPHGGYSEYPTYQPSYGGPPTYRFRQ
jgi:hypothetical protein